MSKKTKIIIIVIGISLVFIFFVIFINRPSINNAKIKFLCAPSEINIQIDNNQKTTVNNNEIVLVSSGNHTIEVTKTDFSSYKATISLENNETKIFPVILTGLTDKAKSEVQADITSQVAEAWSGQSFSSYNNDLTKKYPITSYLPYSQETSGLEYKISINSGASNYNKLQLTVFLNTCSTYSKDIYKNDALSWIKSKGFNPDDYVIDYSTPCD